MIKMNGIGQGITSSIKSQGVPKPNFVFKELILAKKVEKKEVVVAHR